MRDKKYIMKYGKDFYEAYNFAFNEVFKMWSEDLKKIFKIGTKSKIGGCNLSSCILVMIGIEAFSKFYSSKNEEQAFVEFVDNYFHSYYRRKMRKIYKLFRHGLAHYFYPKSEYDNKNYAKISFCVDAHNKVMPLQGVKKHLDYIRSHQNINPSKGEFFEIIPQVLYLDLLDAINKFTKDLLHKSNDALRKRFVEDYLRIKRELGHLKR
jgi:hypothetical protein